MSERAQTYRRLQHLDHLAGHGGDRTGHGIRQLRLLVRRRRGVFAGSLDRRPQPIIDVLFEAQGEDVVSGRRTPDTEQALARSLPTVATELRDILGQLEREFGDVQDVEFTIEDGRL